MLTSHLRKCAFKANLARTMSIKLPQPDLGLAERDPVMHSLIKEEIDRQKKGKQLKSGYQIPVFYAF
jgi:hypothetical protein